MEDKEMEVKDMEGRITSNIHRKTTIMDDFTSIINNIEHLYILGIKYNLHILSLIPKNICIYILF